MAVQLADFADEIETHLRRCLIVSVLRSAPDGSLTAREIHERIRAMSPGEAARAVREVSAMPGFRRVSRGRPPGGGDVSRDPIHPGPDKDPVGF